ncbi:unnamed protein product (macronuclear) [Paramecium tetraurelia]|uniref:Chromosome undetermined scaffold_26, whole genome shotgun sequence n=1 Tax=Paramecium tetraurelia TaxID=5888 RepID=Q3SE87_PARTE|nr:uncharacterized protein GSPATT00009870001 [Paramecium tetraurelia]CAI39037.1 UNC119 homologue, putative [Paramecium tetraurelia]CAK73598.1 unnamed protein product [Paramecium tetraurelia]|eukprot:XP_001440995.1 hypothetical protein (macronuclear) [Paramecium tetraurelia strain d4-2]
MQQVTTEYVRSLNGITQDFLCPVNANIYNIQFLKFRIRDMDSGQTLFEVERDQDEEPIENLPPEYQDEARRIKYHFGPQFFELKTVGAQLTFSVGNQPVKNFTIIERHYFKDHLLRSYEFSFPFCIPNSTNTWEHIYTIPEIDEAMRQEMIDNPFQTKSDSFYFVGEQLVMHNKAEYDYSPFD